MVQRERGDNTTHAQSGPRAEGETVVAKVEGEESHYFQKVWAKVQSESPKTPPQDQDHLAKLMVRDAHLQIALREDPCQEG